MTREVEKYPTHSDDSCDVALSEGPVDAACPRCRALFERYGGGPWPPELEVTIMRQFLRKDAEGIERDVAIKDLLKGDQFRITTNSPADYLYDKQDVIYTVAETPDPGDEGVQVVVDR